MESWSAVQFSAEEFFKQLSNKYCIRNVLDQGIVNLCDYIAGWGTNVTMVVEEDYVDRDYLDDYASYYVKCFQPYDRFCRRIHLFKNFDKERFRRYLEGVISADQVLKNPKEDYIGFVVARPLPSAVIGRTVLRPPITAITEEEEQKGKPSIRCVRNYEANLKGMELSIKGLAFQEQDNVLAACATSALWSALQLSTKRYSYRAPNISEITLNATMYQSTSRPIPSGGLTVGQMCQAISAVGLVAEALEIYSRELDEKAKKYKWIYKLPFLAASYGYLRAGLPVVLAGKVEGLDYHAITLVGYDITDEEPNVNEMSIFDSKADAHLRGSRITSFYAHDDQVAPYCKLPVLFDVMSEFPIQLESRWKIGKKDGDNYRIFTPSMMITPLYHKIRVPFVSTLASATAFESILRFLLGEDFIFEWDIFLSSVNEYKKEISSRQGIPSGLRKRILEQKSPKFFWRLRTFLGDMEICEMLSDATGMELSFQPHALYFFQDDLLKRMVTDYRPMQEVVAGNSDLLRMLDFAHEEAYSQSS